LTPALFTISLLVSIALLIFLILVVKIHPVISLFSSALVLGLTTGLPLLETLGLINSGFGTTLGQIGIPLMLGAIMAIGLIDLKAADAIALFFNRVFKGKNMELAPSLSGFIISIPVFGDITNLLVAPIASRIARIKQISMTTMVAFSGLGLILTHGLVPPTPGILATSSVLEADLGFVVIFGIIASLVAFFSTWLLLKRWIAKEFVPPLPSLAGDPDADLNEGSASVDNELSEQMGRTKTKSRQISPSIAFIPLLIPVVFIASSSIVAIFADEGTALRQVFDVLGDRVVALGSGVLMIVLLAFLYKQDVFTSAMKEDEEITPRSSLTQIVMNSWVVRAMAVAIMPLLVTAMGGAIANIVSENPAVEEIATNIASTNIPFILIPYVIAAVLVASVGSITTAALTAAGILAPMLPVLGLSPEAATLAIGAGSIAVIYINNSGFWIQKQLFNQTTKQALKYITIPTFIASVIAMIVISLFEVTGVL